MNRPPLPFARPSIDQSDIDALRQQITQEVLAGLPQPTTNVQAPAVSVGPGAGGMDPYGQGGGYSTMPTTEGAAEMMGARPDYNVVIPASDGMADQMGFIPGGSVQDQIDFANVQPTTTLPAVTTTPPPVATTPPVTTVAPVIIERPQAVPGKVIEPQVNVAIQEPVVPPAPLVIDRPQKIPKPAFPLLGFNRRRIR